MTDQDAVLTSRGLSCLVATLRSLLAFAAGHLKLSLSLVALVISLAWVAWAAWHGQQTIYSPGPLAGSHDKLACQVCHVKPWQSLQRLFADDLRQARLVMDQACCACHAGLVHHNDEISSAVPNCVSCHREHQGAHGLALVADHFCTGCHADLQTKNGPSTCFASSVSSLAAHPEFAVLRRGTPDPGTIRFHHALHLGPAGVRGADGKSVFLKCASCHQPTPNGRYMKPIRFHDHCTQCHANTLVYDAACFRDQRAPHGLQPDLLLGWLQARYTQFIQGHPKGLEKGTECNHSLPGRANQQEVTRENWIWVHQQVAQADRVLFQHSGGCRYCHQVEVKERGWNVAPVNILGRWLTHSKFSHFAHRFHPKPAEGQENCTSCHEAARSSSKTSDILMPSLQKCQECHNQGNRPSTGKTDCIHCHIYHNQIGGRRPGD